ncbi:MAG TPA: patatin-like phospholipase family protein [Actinomycetota bacterium]|nr:patatin-like phospholipase family protein [Actinomycetota bacterium]
MNTGLVLGGGGLIGMGYHAGALKALDEWGLDVPGADMIVGTSAGAILAAYLGIGWTPTDFFEYAHGRHPDSVDDPLLQAEETRALFDPLSRSRQERVRRSVGGMFALAASRGLWRGGTPPSRLRRLFPAGLYSSEGSRERLAADLPKVWPRPNLIICTTDLYNGRRTPFGAPDAPPAPFPLAVLASTSIPGFFPPVKIGGRQYVDGGISSPTSLDLAAERGCKHILCIAPLGYLRDAPRPELRALMPMAMRSWFAKTLKGEVNKARANGADVLVIRPWTSDLGAHGTNAMRHFDRAALVEAARAGTLRFLEQHQDHPVLKAFQKPTRKHSPSAKRSAASNGRKREPKSDPHGSAGGGKAISVEDRVAVPSGQSAAKQAGRKASAAPRRTAGGKQEL